MPAACLLKDFAWTAARRSVRKSLLEEVQELEARSVDPGAAVLRDASSRRWTNLNCCTDLSKRTGPSADKSL